MREIKFRAWDKTNKKMHYGVGILGSAIYIDFNGQKEYEEVNGHELMQYTGAKDKNGREIYEGDVVKRKYEVWGANPFGNASSVLEKAGTYIGVVNYRPSVGFIMNSCRHYDANDNFIETLSGIKIYSKHSKVIGNIYEHPELL